MEVIFGKSPSKSFFIELYNSSLKLINGHIILI